MAPVLHVHYPWSWNHPKPTDPSFHPGNQASRPTHHHSGMTAPQAIAMIFIVLTLLIWALLMYFCCYRRAKSKSWTARKTDAQVKKAQCTRLWSLLGMSRRWFVKGSLPEIVPTIERKLDLVDLEANVPPPPAEILTEGTVTTDTDDPPEEQDITDTPLPCTWSTSSEDWALLLIEQYVDGLSADPDPDSPPSMCGSLSTSDSPPMSPSPETPPQNFIPQIIIHSCQDLPRSSSVPGITVSSSLSSCNAFPTCDSSAYLGIPSWSMPGAPSTGTETNMSNVSGKRFKLHAPPRRKAKVKGKNVAAKEVKRPFMLDGLIPASLSITALRSLDF